MTSSSIHLWQIRSIVPSKTSFAGLWWKEYISNYLTVEMTMQQYFKLFLVEAQLSIPLTENLSRNPNLGQGASVWHHSLCT